MRKLLLIAIGLCICVCISNCGGGGGTTVNRITPESTATVGAAISGTVYAPSGVPLSQTAGRQAQASATGKDNPVPGSTVAVKRMKSDGSLESLGDDYQTTTDDDGKFTINAVPQEDNLVIETTKTLNDGGNSKTLRLRKVISVTDTDVTTGSITGIEVDASTTLCAEIMKDVVTTANQGIADTTKITARDLPREMVEYLEGDIQTALTSDQADNSPMVDLSSVATGGDSSIDTQLTGLEDSSHGATLKTRKEKATTKGSVRVHVVVINSGEPPLEGATVILTINGQVQTGTTNDKGNAFFYDIEPGSSLDIEVRKTGYVMVKTSQNIERAAIVNNVTVHMTPGETNQAPVAKAGPDQSVSTGTTVSLDGTSSFDPDGDTITYTWTQTAGTTVALSTTTTATATFTPTASGTYTFSLVVNDGNLASDADTVSIGVSGVIACSADTDCDDGNSLTVDTCSNPGTENSVCQNVACSVACSSDTDCNDNNTLTLGTCSNPGICDAVCNIVTIACNSNPDCSGITPICISGGTSSAACITCSSDTDCDDGDATTTDTCSNSGTVSASCSHTPCVPTCSTGGDCDDGNSETMDFCLSSGSCTAFCYSRDKADTISAGDYHTCAVLSSGSIKCWGQNNEGQLGNGDTTNSSTPVDISGITDAVSIASGLDHSCALSASGTISCWGDNGNGELGNGALTDSLIPVSTSGISDAISISAGTRTSCAVLSSGSIMCWGYNNYGQCGTGSTAQHLTPSGVIGIANGVEVDVAHQTTCAGLSDGSSACWGDNSSGDFGNGTTLTSSSVPVYASGITDAISVSAGDGHVCVLHSNNTISCWGFNSYGQIGDGTTTNTSLPHNVQGIGDVVQIKAGSLQTCVLISDGTIRCWGRNDYGQLGDGTFFNSLSPVTVSGIADAVSLSVGVHHACALLHDGKIKCWGYNYHGQLGDGTTNNSNVPVSVIGF